MWYVQQCCRTLCPFAAVRTVEVAIRLGARLSALAVRVLGVDESKQIVQVDQSGHPVDRPVQFRKRPVVAVAQYSDCLLYTSPSPRDRQKSRMPSSA